MVDVMTFPASVEEFMEQYKMTDTEQVYSNGTEYVPIYRMRQWFEHCRNQQQPTIDAIHVVRCYECKYWKKDVAGCTENVGRCEYANYFVGKAGYCVYGERKEGAE